jgi:hypothetical protein
VRKAQIIGAVAGALLTIAILIFNANATAVNPENYGPAMLLGLVSLPSFPMLALCKVIGLKFLFDDNHNQGGASIPLECLLVAANVISYFAIGTFIGVLIQSLKAKKSN